VSHTSLIDETQLHAMASGLAQAISKENPSLQQAGTGIIYLDGPLGAGKSTFVRALLQALGVQDRIKSPTYTLVENYHVQLNVNSTIDFYHFDLYRFTTPEEWREAGFDDILQPPYIALIEWPSKALGLLPSADLVLHLAHNPLSDHTRAVTMTANTARGHSWLKHMST
jgi:tRNA threonylcarbamoyladenosine biosynthesis protein TsaE